MVISSRLKHVSRNAPVGHTRAHMDEFALDIRDFTDYGLSRTGRNKLNLATTNHREFVLLGELAASEPDCHADRIQLVIRKSTADNRGIDVLNRDHLLLLRFQFQYKYYTTILIYCQPWASSRSFANTITAG